MLELCNVLLEQVVDGAYLLNTESGNGSNSAAKRLPQQQGGQATAQTAYAPIYSW
jgi:hypothetical protein